MLTDEVFRWLKAQPSWQQDLARRLTCQVDLDGAEYSEALSVVKAAFGLLPRETHEPQELGREDLAESAAGGATRLLALGGLLGVGLVGGAERLTFGATGLTVVYGQNAAGKSTYVRTLKRLCRTVDRDCRVRASIFDATAPTTPSAEIRVETDGEVTELRTALDGSAAIRLAGMSVFDAACAELYVDAQNVVQYLPTELRLLARLGTVQDRMRQDLDAERQALLQSRPPTGNYPYETTVGKALASLKGNDHDPDLSALATLAGQDQVRLTELRGAVAAAEGSTARADAALAERDVAEAESLIEAIEALHQRASSEASDQLRRLVEEAEVAEQAVQLAAVQLRGPIEGVGGGPWRVMWNAARAFVESSEGSFPPGSGSPCPLCLQPVAAATADRLAHFEAHITSSVQNTAEARKSELASALEACGPENADEVLNSALLVALSDREPDVAAPVAETVNAVRLHLERMSASPRDAIGAVTEVGPAVDVLTRWASARAVRAKTLRNADDAGRLPELRAELAELEARVRLAGELPLFSAWKRNLARIALLDAAYSGLATNKITIAQKGLIENELAKALEAALSAELAWLACALPVELRTSTAKVETSVGLRLLANDPPRVSDIASEGERRALALSFFFAELEVSSNLGGIVVDDPVSSLDDERRIYIAQRLVQEAARRQVIVFTHDLPFVYELRSRAKDAGLVVHVQHVWRLGDAVGRVDAHLPFKVMNLNQRIEKLAAEVVELRKTPPATADDAWRQVDGFYKRVRTTWERAVEERLFAGVVERFERDVKTKSLKDVHVTPELIQQVEDGMTRSSGYIHEDAFRAQMPLPSVQDMAADVESLREFARLSKIT